MSEKQTNITSEETEKAQEEATDKFTEAPIEEETGLQNIPPNSFERNAFGLYKHLNYIFTEDGYVDYYKMLKPEHIVLNRRKKEAIEKKYKKTFDEIDIEKDKVEDEDLVILLAGIRFLAALRGFISVDYDFESNEEGAYTKCIMTFLGNYETNHRVVCFSALAERHRANLVGIFQNFPLSLSENGAFVRCVRSFLRIPIMAQDEIIGVKEDEEVESEEELSPVSPHAALDSYLKAKACPYKKLHQKLIKKVNDKNEPLFPDAEKWVKITDIPKETVLPILTMLKEKNAKEPH